MEIDINLIMSYKKYNLNINKAIKYKTIIKTSYNKFKSYEKILIEKLEDLRNYYRKIINEFDFLVYVENIFISS